MGAVKFPALDWPNGEGGAQTCIGGPLCVLPRRTIGCARNVAGLLPDELPSSSDSSRYLLCTACAGPTATCRRASEAAARVTGRFYDDSCDDQRGSRAYAG